MVLKFSIKYFLFIVSIIDVALSLVIIFFTTPILYYNGSHMKINPASFESVQILQNTNEDTGTGTVAVTGTVTGLENLNVGLPVRLKIPVISLDSIVESVGFTSDGAMGIPKNQEDVAWFNLGQRPGEIGNAVIDGHYGWKSKKPSAFDGLYKLRIGDKIFVEDDQGAVVSFVVRESRRYDQSSNAPDVFVSKDDKSHLNLITCEGEWDKVSRTYPNRLVVFADKE